MKDASYFSGRGCENVGVKCLCVSVRSNIGKAEQPVIAYIMFISACLRMRFEDIWLKQYFNFIQVVFSSI